LGGEQAIRDLRKNTEMLILVKLLRTPSVRMKDVAAELGITVQAVSQYISSMKRKGLLSVRTGRPAPTRVGVQSVQEHFTSMKSEIDGILRKISVIDTCEAIAGKRIEKGQAVGLVMEDGMLLAYPNRKSSSRGVAAESADVGDDVLVGSLEGIVDLELGKLLVIETPSELEGGSKNANPVRLRQVLDSFSPGLLVAGDVVGAATLMKASGEMFTIHAPIESAMSALSKGVDVAFSGTSDSVVRMLDTVSELRKQTGYEVKWRSVKA